MNRFIIDCSGQMIQAPDTLAKLVDRENITFLENYDCFFILYDTIEDFFFVLKVGDLPRKQQDVVSDCVMQRLRVQTRIRDAAWIVGHKRKFIYDGHLYIYTAEPAVDEAFLAIYEEVVEDDLLIADYQCLESFHKSMVQMYGALYAGLRDQLPDATAIDEVQHFIDLIATIHSIL